MSDKRRRSFYRMRLFYRRLALASSVVGGIIALIAVALLSTGGGSFMPEIDPSLIVATLLLFVAGVFLPRMLVLTYWRSVRRRYQEEGI